MVCLVGLIEVHILTTLVHTCSSQSYPRNGRAQPEKGQVVTDALGVAVPCQRGSVVGIQLAGLSCGGEWEASGSSGHSQAWYWKSRQTPREPPPGVLLLLSPAFQPVPAAELSLSYTELGA